MARASVSVSRKAPEVGVKQVVPGFIYRGRGGETLLCLTKTTMLEVEEDRQHLRFLTSKNSGPIVERLFPVTLEPDGATIMFTQSLAVADLLSGAL